MSYRRTPGPDGGEVGSGGRTIVGLRGRGGSSSIVYIATGKKNCREGGKRETARLVAWPMVAMASGRAGAAWTINIETFYKSFSNGGIYTA